MRPAKRPTLVALGALLAGSLAFGAPASAAPVAWHAPGRPPATTQTPLGPVTELTLANGLRVILVENHAAPVVAFSVTYRVGARNESLGETGCAHLLEHMLFKGTKTLGKGQIAQLLGRNGANYNASTWPDYTNFYETYGSDRLELGFVVEASRMRDALILDSERQSEMTVVRNEMEGDESDPANQLYQEVTETAFQAHPYHHPTIGWRSDVEGVSTTHLKQFYDTFYQPNNAVVVLVGDFSPERAIALAHRYFDPMPKGPTPPRLYTTEEPQLGERRVILRRRGDTNLLQVAFHIPQASSHDLAPLYVLDSLLTNGMASRLQQALVVSEQASRVWSEVGVQRDSSLFRVGADLEPAHDGKTDHATVEAALWRALDRLRTSLVPQADLERARRQTLALYAFSNEGAEDLAQELGSFAVRDRWQRSFELQAEIARVTASDLNRVVKAYLTRDNATTGWYVGTPDGPVPQAPANAGGGKAVASSARVVPPPLFDFERQAPVAPHPAPPVHRKLANGLDVWVLPVPASRTVAFDGFLRAGDDFDPPGKLGVAQTVANLLDVGSTRHDKLQQAMQLEDVGANLEFDAGPLVTTISGQCLPEDTARVVDALAERLRDPVFPAAEVERMAETVKASLKQGDDDPATRAHRALARLIYPPGHPLYQDTPEEAGKQLDSITRADLVDYHAHHYGPNTTTLVLVGNLDADRVLDGIQAAFGDWARVADAAVTLPVVAVKPGTRVAIDMPGKTETEILVGHAGNIRRTDPHFFAYALANEILGGDTWSSRLGAKLRDEMGLTYGTYAELDAGIVAGPWDATLSVNPANAAPAIAALQQELERFAHDGVTEQEVAFAKRSFIGQQAQSLATNAGMAHSIARMAMYDLGEDYWTHYPELISKVSAAEVNEAARALVHPDATNLVVVGPGASKLFSADRSQDAKGGR